MLATPSSLIALLRMIALGWREQALAVNAQEVAQLGRQLYERVGSLATHWSDVGDKLEKAVGAYNKSVGALETRVLVTARKFVDLKAATADDGELAAPQPVEALPRPLLAPELVGARFRGRAGARARHPCRRQLNPAETARHRSEHRGGEGGVQNERPNPRGRKAVFERVELGVEAFGHCIHLVAQRSNVDFDVCHIRAQMSDVRLESSDARFHGLLHRRQSCRQFYFSRGRAWSTPRRDRQPR